MTEFGSLCGGGRYDDLVKRFDPKGQFQVSPLNNHNATRTISMKLIIPVYKMTPPKCSHTPPSAGHHCSASLDIPCIAYIHSNTLT